MLVEILHECYKASDNNNSIRLLFIDFAKAFDRINNNILIEKIHSFGTYPTLTNWLAAFLTNRTQKVRIGKYLSTEVHMKGILPQGALFGMEGFMAMVNNLKCRLLYKYVDDGTVAEILPNNEETSHLQEEIYEIVKWKEQNDMKINPSKTKEMCISFTNPQKTFTPIQINNSEIERVEITKLLGLTIQSNLKLDKHIDNIVRKANMKLHFLIQLKRAGALEKDLVNYYKSIVRSILEYAIPAWSTNITKEQIKAIEQIQKRTLKIIKKDNQENNYTEELEQVTLAERRLNLCKRFFERIIEPNNVTNYLLPKKADRTYKTRINAVYPLPHIRTDRYKNSYIPFCLFNFQ